MSNEKEDYERRNSGPCFLRGPGGCGGPEKERRHFGIHGGEKAGQTEKATGRI